MSRIKAKNRGKCPYCGSIGFWMSKSKLACAILKMIGFGSKKSIYSDGNFSKEEMFAIYEYLRTIHSS